MNLKIQLSGFFEKFWHPCPDIQGLAVTSWHSAICLPIPTMFLCNNCHFMKDPNMIIGPFGAASTEEQQGFHFLKKHIFAASRNSNGLNNVFEAQIKEINY